jgi:hypothetical protein
MNAYAITGAATAVLVYISLTAKVLGKSVIQNFATYFLWGLLDIIAAIAIGMDHGNFLLPAIYALLSIGVCIVILHTGTFKWSRDETITSAFVFASIIVWFFMNGKMATIVSTTGVVVACWPQLKDLWKNPREAPVFEYMGFAVANALSTMAGHTWSIQERFYGAACTAAAVVIVLVGARKWLPQFRAQLT